MADVAPTSPAPPVEVKEEPAAPPQPFSDIPDDDPIFQVQEPHRGLPPTKEILKALPDDARRRVANVVLEGRKAHEARTAAETALAARDAELAEAKRKLESMVATNGDPLPYNFDDSKESLIVKRFLGLDDGDPFEGEDDDADVAPVRAVLTEEGLSEKAANALLDVVKGVRAKARADMVRAFRTTSKPAIAASQEYRQQQVATQAAKLTSDWRSAHEGMADDAAFGEVYAIARGLFPERVDKATGGLALTDAQKEAAYVQWKASRPVVAPPKTEVVVTKQAPPKNAGLDALLLLQGRASERQAGATKGAPDAVPSMPQRLIATNDKEGQRAWREQQFAAVPGLRERYNGDEKVRRAMLGLDAQR